MVQDVFPITEKYIEREFIKFGKHFMITSEALIKELEKKAKTIINLSMRGVKFLPTQVDINTIIKKLDAKNILVTKTIPASKKTEKITFTMPSDKEGFVYCKWRPKESTVADDAFWIVDLDVPSCKTYIREVK